MTDLRPVLREDARLLIRHIDAGHGLDEPAFRTDLTTFDKNAQRALGTTDQDYLDQILRNDVDIHEKLEAIVESVDTLDGLVEHDALTLLRAIASHFTVPPPALPRGGIWSTKFSGQTITGRSPMGVAVQEGFGADLTFQPTDGAGESDTLAKVTFDTDDATVLTVTDGAAPAAPFTARYDVIKAANAGKTANVRANVTDPDGNTVAVLYAVAVLAADATGGTFTSGPVTATPAVVPGP